MNRIVPGGGDEDAPKLEMHHLFEKRVERDRARLRAYNQILAQIQTRIRSTAELIGNPSYLLYTVPPFILGLPAIDMQDCIVYIVHQLRMGGFEVKFTYPNLLYISWKHYEKEYMREQNPITQAMKPPAPTNTSKKGVGGKRGGGGADATRSVTFAPATDLSNIGKGMAAPKSAAEYQPPDSFLQGLQRPTEKVGGGTGAAGGGGGSVVNRTESVLADLWKF
jgi:hypothetical protein